MGGEAEGIFWGLDLRADAGAFAKCEKCIYHMLQATGSIPAIWQKIKFVQYVCSLLFGNYVRKKMLEKFLEREDFF